MNHHTALALQLFILYSSHLQWIVLSILWFCIITYIYHINHCAHSNSAYHIHLQYRNVCIVGCPVHTYCNKLLNPSSSNVIIAISLAETNYLIALYDAMIPLLLQYHCHHFCLHYITQKNTTFSSTPSSLLPCPSPVSNSQPDHLMSNHKWFLNKSTNYQLIVLIFRLPWSKETTLTSCIEFWLIYSLNQWQLKGAK